MEPSDYNYNPPNNSLLSVNQKRAVALVAVLVVILACVGLLTTIQKHVASDKFRVLSTNPSVNYFADVSPFFKVTYNKPLSKSDLSVTSNPGIIKSYSVSGDTLTTLLNVPLNNTRDYSIFVLRIKDTAGVELKNQVFTFKPKLVNSNDLSKSQQNALLQAQENAAALQKKEDPIMPYLPYSTLNFILNDAYVNNKLILQAQILIPPHVSGAAAAADTTQYEQQVVQYIQSLGLNPANYTIQYQIVNESLNGV